MHYSIVYVCARLRPTYPGLPYTKVSNYISLLVQNANVYNENQPCLVPYNGKGVIKLPRGIKNQ